MARTIEQTKVGVSSTSRLREKSFDKWAGYAFIAPAMFFFAVFTVFPVLFGAYLSLWKIKTAGLEFISFTGFDNFSTMLGNEDFQIGLWNTARFSFFVVTIQTIVALLLAVTVNSKIRGKTFFRTAFFFPSISSSVVISIIFLWVFNKFGLINNFLSIFGIQWADLD